MAQIKQIASILITVIILLKDLLTSLAVGFTVIFTVLIVFKDSFNRFKDKFTVTFDE